MKRSAVYFILVLFILALLIVSLYSFKQPSIDTVLSRMSEYYFGETVDANRRLLSLHDSGRIVDIETGNPAGTFKTDVKYGEYIHREATNLKDRIEMKLVKNMGQPLKLYLRSLDSDNDFQEAPEIDQTYVRYIQLLEKFYQQVDPPVAVEKLNRVHREIKSKLFFNTDYFSVFSYDNIKYFLWDDGMLDKVELKTPIPMSPAITFRFEGDIQSNGIKYPQTLIIRWQSKDRFKFIRETLKTE